jgi:fatty acid desaturase
MFVLMSIVGMALVLLARELLPATGAYVGWIAGTILVAVAINAMVLLLHEGMHRILFRNQVANRLVSMALGACFLMSFTAYQVLHIRHHDYLGDPRDPDDYRNYTDSPTLLWVMHFGRLFLGAFLYILLIPWLALKHGDSGERRRVVEEYFILALVYTLALMFLPGEALLWAWFVPLILVGFMMNIRGFTQHGFTDAHDPYLASRSIYPRRAISFLLLNENLHLEHHLFPEIPGYNLPALHGIIEPKLPRKVVGRTYLGFVFTFLKRTLTLDKTTIGLERTATSTTSSPSGGASGFPIG